MSGRTDLVWTTTLRLMVLGLGLVTSVLVARFLGPEARGIHLMILTTSLLLASIGGLSGELGFASLLGRRQTYSRDKVIATLGYGSVLAGTALGALCLAIGTTIWQAGLIDFGSLDAMQALLLLSGLVLAYVVNAWAQYALNLQGRARTSAACAAVDVSLTLTIVLSALLMDDLSLRWVVIASLSGSTTSAAIAVVATRAPLRSIDFHIFGRAMGAGTRFHVSQVGLQMLMRLDILILGILAGVASVGHYGVALSITAPLMVLAGAVSSTFVQRQFVASEAKAAQATNKLFGATALIVVMVAIVIGLSGWFAIPLIWGSAFEESRLILLILLPGVVAQAAQRPIGQYFVRTSATRVMTGRVFIALAINTFLDICLIPEFGALGAAVASSIAYMAYAGVSLLYFMGATGLSRADVVREVTNAARAMRPASANGASDA